MNKEKLTIPYATARLHETERFAELDQIKWSDFPKLRKDLIRYVCEEYEISAIALESVIVDFDFITGTKEEFHSILKGVKK